MSDQDRVTTVCVWCHLIIVDKPVTDLNGYRWHREKCWPRRREYLYRVASEVTARKAFR